MSFADRYKRVLDRCARVLGEDATYRSADGSVEQTVRGIPSREAIEIMLGQMSQSMTRRTTFGVNVKTLADNGVNPKEGDTLIVRGMTFKIKSISYDGEGGAELILSKT